MARMGLVLLAALTLLLSGTPRVSAQYITAYEAITQLGCTRFKALLDTPGSVQLKAALSRAETEVVVFAPTDAAFQTAEASYAVQFPNNSFLSYHVIPGTSAAFTDGAVLQTFFPPQTQAIANVTIRINKGIPNGQGLVAGLAPGAMFNTSFNTGGQSRVYLTDNILIPPARLPLGPLILPGLNLIDALNYLQSQSISIWNQLLAADPELLAYFSNADLSITMLVPFDTAMTIYLRCVGQSVQQFQGTATARRLIQAHILPERPYALRSFPQGGQVNSSSGYLLPVQSDNSTGTLSIAISGKNIFVRDLRAGKSIMHFINGVIAPGDLGRCVYPPSPPAFGSITPGTTDYSSPTSPSSSSGKKEGPSLAAIGGAVAGGVIGAILLAAGIAYIIHRRNRQARLKERERLARLGLGRGNGMDSQMQLYVNAPLYGRRGRSDTMRANGAGGQSGPRKSINVQGFMFGDQFVRSTAPQYSWVDLPADGSIPGVEAGVNDAQLDAQWTPAGSPIMRLSRAEVVKQIRLLNGGLLGRGASALVFKCQWPSRFGPNALLAIKVLKDPYEADPSVYESFCYEAAVLASVRHPNVVAMYGFCLELPTACIIMELCPGTLKDRLYRPPPGATSLPASQTVSATSPGVDAPGSGTLGHSKSLDKPTAEKEKTRTLSMDKPNPPHSASGILTANSKPESASSGPGTSTPPRTASRTRTARVNAAGQQLVGPPAVGLHVQYNNLTMAEVLQYAADVAAGLAHLHRRPAIMALPTHPTLMLESEHGLALPASSLHANDISATTIPASALPSHEDEDDDIDENKAVARIVHRDLKPSNILVNSHNRCKISDFGLARWHSNTTVHTGTLGVGTLRYMAPELLLGHYSGRGSDADPVTNRVDIYSLGMLCFEMATSQMPWTDLTDAQIVAAVINNKRPNLEGSISDAVEPEIDLLAAEAITTLLTKYHLDETPEEDNAMPDTLGAFPALMTVINNCWQQTDIRRPPARTVHKALMALTHAFQEAERHTTGTH